ncbi:MAG: N-methyl-L-tryptophan oxidase [Phycisphaerales bacterium]
MLDAIVVGVGTMGAAACNALARRGAAVLGLEQFDIPHALGAHHGHSRLFRTAYYEHPDYVPLLREAFDLWQGLERRARQRLFQVTGVLYLGSEEGEVLPRSMAVARTHAIPFESLGVGALADRFPWFRVPTGFTGMWEPQAGLVVPELAVAMLAAEAIRQGAEIHARERVLTWADTGTAVRVRTRRDWAGHEREIEAKSIVFASGAWTDRIVRDLGVPLVVTRQPVAWVGPRDAAAFEIGAFPCWAIEADDRSLYYGFPILPTAPGLKVGRHLRGEITDPDAVDRTPRSTDIRPLLDCLTQHLPDAVGPLLGTAVCTYTNSPDGHFIIDRIGPRAAIACGFSGHGFKFAPMIGEILADLALEGSTSRPASFLSLQRFRT